MPKCGVTANMLHGNKPENAVKMSGPLLVALIVSLTGCAGSAVSGATERESQREHRVLEPGKRQFLVSCSGCHGNDARGNGPIAPILSIPVPDLTLIS